ncbi:Sigma factor regulator N-terminal [Paenibacillus sophorae]|uniref:Anti-sigma factor n=1 Tax=Paenibacillus sophorae TaxID=1333845 RepID=A0A1H8L0I6_9BACL|nr:anti-sigma factor [Paenibacillus sophorae]QWU17481.1 anti-sigma factor [Paenibacillus sophorae]SEN98645.1 Sigma factor regulator N-terminal [Paenibacillus sophorae]
MTAPWEGQEDQELTKTIKKAKRRILLRNLVIIAVSLVSSMIVIFAILLGVFHLTGREANKAWMDEWGYMSISKPNEYESGYKNQSGFLSGVLELDTYKIVEGVPIPWNEYWSNYQVTNFPNFSGTYGGTGGLTVTDPQMKAQGYEYYRQYNPYNGQRELAFYVPGVNYNGKVLNDLSALSRMESGKLVEMALSFDKDYSFAEVKAMLPAGVRPVWYWVDTYDDRTNFHFKPFKDGNGNISYPLPMSPSFGVYGFGIRPDWDKAEPGDFIQTLKGGLHEKGKYYSEYERIYNYLKKDKAEPDAGDVRLLGVVVTGTAKGLQSLNGQPYVRGAVLGAVTDRY